MLESTTEIMKGLCFYFDKALPVMLLYKSERQQYADAIADDVSPSMVYGAEHLLRLFGNRCSIQFYATLVLIGGFMVFIPKNMNPELVIFFWFVAIINPDYHRKPPSPGVPEANWTHAAAHMLLLRGVKSGNNDDQITLSVQVRCTNPFGALAQLYLSLGYCI
uniref:MSL n=1 Tax=Populus tomentosa TaxID=118781 RepID=U3Q030_POPTO|nr:MSL [Populus tomentosa]